MKVSEKTRGKRSHVKFASAQDLRRAFGFRWSHRVMPAVLQQLMRHEDIKTTLTFYATRNAEATADAAWEWDRRQRITDTFTDTSPKTVKSP